MSWYNPSDIYEKAMTSDSTATSTTDAKPWEETIPYWQDLYGDAFSQLKPGEGTTNTKLQSAWDQYYAKAAQGTPSIATAQKTNENLIRTGGNLDPRTYQAQGYNPNMQYLGATLRGNYQNPYLDRTFNMAADKVTENYLQNVVPGVQSQANMAGRYGSGAMQTQQNNANEAYGETLNNLATQIYGGSYEAERARQAAAEQQATNVMAQSGMFSAGATNQARQYNAQQLTAAQQQEIENQMNAIKMAPYLQQAGYGDLDRMVAIGQAQQQQEMQNQMLPYQQYQALANLLASSGGGTSTSTQPVYSPGWLSTGVQAGMAAAPFLI